MKKIVKTGLIFIFAISLILPLTPQVQNSSLLENQTMNLIYGGKEELNCNAIALFVEAGCYAAGGGWLSCAFVTAGDYSGCLAANALLGE